MEDYEDSMEINVKSVINLTKLCLPYLVAEKGIIQKIPQFVLIYYFQRFSLKGSIVNVSSVTGSRSFPGVLAYCMSKAALDQFTKCVRLIITELFGYTIYIFLIQN